jgi:hypothetical protein
VPYPTGSQLDATQAPGNYCNLKHSFLYSELLGMTDLTRTGIRALPNQRSSGFDGSTSVAILRYYGATIEDPTPDSNADVPTSVLPLIETDLHVSSRC